MGTFIIKKRFNNDYKFVFSSRKGKIIFTSVSCSSKSVNESMIAEIKNNIVDFGFTRLKNAAGKYFFKLTKEGSVFAISRKYATEPVMQKGIDEIVKYVSVAEILDFSEGNFIFPDTLEVFEQQK
ncbi:MAG: DUF1508 domain-containing protein [Burkholderiales bacterium]|nr:DUF1508 domain-containing protein [Flavobacterium sp.]